LQRCTARLRRFPERLSDGGLHQGAQDPGPADAAARRAVLRSESGADQICRVAARSVRRRGPAADRGFVRKRASNRARRDGSGAAAQSLIMAKKKDDGQKIVADNRKARHLYFIESTLEAGLVLGGSEVKSLRAGKANIAEAYAAAKDGEIYLVNAYIPEYLMANRFNHEPRRTRKLLIRRSEMRR